MRYLQKFGLTLDQDPAHGGQRAAEWGTRETFIAVVTTNLPMIFPLFKSWLYPLLSSTFRSTSNNKAYKLSEGGFVSIGGGGVSSHNRAGLHSRVTGNMTHDNESEEHIVKDKDNIHLQHMQSSRAKQPSPNANEIMVSQRISVTTEKF